MFSETVTYWISHYGYAGLFGLLALGIVGLPIPDETLLVYTGYLISKGQLSPAAAYLAAFGGSAFGITLSYLIGRSGGHLLMVKYGGYFHCGPTKIERVHRWYLRVGKWFLLFGYFLVGIRHLTALVAGSSRLEFKTFALFAYGGAFVWSASFISAGWWMGKRWHIVAHEITRHIPLVTIGFIIALTIYVFVRRKFFSAPANKKV